MKIAICDDEVLCLKQIHNALLAFQEQEGEFDIKVFKSGEEFLRGFSCGSYDMIILDIEMGGMSGLKTAEEVRKLDSKVMLIFLTNHAEFALQGYRVNAYRYILKDESNYMYMQQLRSVISEYRQSVRLFEMSNRSSKLVCRLEEIYYFEVMNKTIKLHKSSLVFEFPGKITDIEKRLGAYDFVKTHKSYLVNLAHVDYLNFDRAIMDNKETVPIGRTFKNTVNDEYIRYVAGK